MVGDEFRQLAGLVEIARLAAAKMRDAIHSAVRPAFPAINGW
jgi:hypothetical protein